MISVVRTRASTSIAFEEGSIGSLSSGRKGMSAGLHLNAKWGASRDAGTGNWPSGGSMILSDLYSFPHLIGSIVSDAMVLDKK